MKFSCLVKAKAQKYFPMDVKVDSQTETVGISLTDWAWGTYQNYVRPVFQGVSNTAAAVSSHVSEQVQYYHLRTFNSLEITALIVTTTAQARNSSYLSAIEQDQDCSCLLTPRIRYVEAILVASVCIIHNLVMAIFMTVLAILGLLCCFSVCSLAKRYWAFTVVSTAALGVGLIGVASPAMASDANTWVVNTCYEYADLLGQ